MSNTSQPEPDEELEILVLRLRTIAADLNTVIERLTYLYVQMRAARKPKGDNP